MGALSARLTGDLGWRLARSFAFAAGSFLILGTVSALWDNPFFTRMSPAGAIEIGLLALSCVLVGTYAFVRSSACGTRATWLGGVANFLGVACPTCNKLLFFALGPQVLTSYYEPVRLYVAAAGAMIVALGVLQAIRGRSRGAPDRPAASAPSQGSRAAEANSHRL